MSKLKFFQTVEVLSDVSASELALRLYLQCAQVYDRLVYDHPVSKPSDIVMSWKCLNPQAANDCELETVAYEFFTKAYLLYEEEISVSEFLTRIQAFL